MKHEAFRRPRSRTGIPAFTQGTSKALGQSGVGNRMVVGQTPWPRPGIDFAACLTKGQR
jgi:hypothetical protein